MSLKNPYLFVSLHFFELICVSHDDTFKLVCAHTGALIVSRQEHIKFRFQLGALKFADAFATADKSNERHRN